MERPPTSTNSPASCLTRTTSLGDRTLKTQVVETRTTPSDVVEIAGKLKTRVEEREKIQGMEAVEEIGTEEGRWLRRK